LNNDAALGENWRVGAYGGFSQSWFSVPDRSSSGSMDNYDLGLYAGAQFGAAALRLGGGYAWHDVSVSRTVAFPGYAGVNTSGYTAGTAQMFGELAYDVSLNGIALEPFAGLAYLHLDGGSATEVGSSSALMVDGGSMDTLYSTLGIRGATTLTLGGQTFAPNFTLGWQHAFGDTAPQAMMTYVAGSSPFPILGAPIAADALAVGVGIAYAISPQAKLSVNYDGTIATTAAQNAVVGQLQVRF
jgi:outer membrane autotransporter protein